MMAIAGGKGGCGKTTTTLGLAGALARQRKAALAVDADREMPDLHALAGVAREPGLDAVGEGWPPGMVAGTADAPASGAAVLPAGSRRPDRRRSDPGPQSALTRVREFAGTVLLDCPAGAGPDAVGPLRVADAAVVVTTVEPACLRDAAKTVAMARELGTPVAGAIVSRVGNEPGKRDFRDGPGGASTLGNSSSTNATAGPDNSSTGNSSVGDPNTDGVPDGVTDLLGCPVLGVVPDVGAGSGVAPLADDRVRAAHDRVVSALQPKYL